MRVASLLTFSTSHCYYLVSTDKVGYLVTEISDSGLIKIHNAIFKYTIGVVTILAKFCSYYNWFLMLVI